MCVGASVLILTIGIRSLLQCMMDSAAVFLSCLVYVSFVQTSRHLLHPEIETPSLSFCVSLPGVLKGHTHRDIVSDSIKAAPHSCLHMLPVD